MVCIWIPSVANEADSSAALNLFDAGVERFNSASTPGISELSVMKKSDPELHFPLEEKLLQILSCHVEQRQSFRKLFSHITLLCSILCGFSSKYCSMIVVVLKRSEGRRVKKLNSLNCVSW
jgi:hypothetical protein